MQIPATGALALALAVVLTGCADTDAPHTATTPEPAVAAAQTPTPSPANTDAVGMPLQTSPGTLDAGHLADFSGAALEAVRQRARDPDVTLDAAARSAIDAAAAERDCAGVEEARVFQLDLDGVTGDEALALYTAYGCHGMDNYFERNGIVLRGDGGAWTTVAEFSLGTRMVGGARITALEPGTVVVTADEGSDASGGSTVIPPR